MRSTPYTPVLVAVKRVLWLVYDAIRELAWGQGRAREIYIDPKRINDEDRIARRRQMLLDDDMEYRARVMKRMVEGLTAREMPPLYNRAKLVEKRRMNVAQFKDGVRKLGNGNGEGGSQGGGSRC